MAQLKVFIVSDDKETRYKLKAVLDVEDIAIVGYGDMQLSAVQKAQGLSPNVVIVCHRDGTAFEIAQRIYQSVTGCAIVFASEALTMDTVSAALQCGVRLCVGLDESDERLIDTVRRAGALERARAGASEERVAGECRVVSVFSGKGGTGKTTIAVNLASAMSAAGRKAAIIDLSLECPCVALFLDVQAKDTVAELSQERGSLTMETIRAFTVQHYSGLTVIAGPGSPEDAEFVDAHKLEAIISVMRMFFDCIVLDLGSNYSELTLTALENSDRILIALQSDIASVKAAHVALGILASLQLRDKVSIIFNKAAPRSFLSVKDVKKALGCDVAFTLPLDSQTADKCQCIGRPIIAEAPSSQLAKHLKSMANEVFKE